MLLRTFQRRPSRDEGAKPAARSTGPSGGRPGGRDRPRNSPGRIARRMLVVAALVVVAFLAQRGGFQHVSDDLFGARIDWHNDYAMSEHLYDLLVRRRVTDVPRACLLLNIHGADPAASTGIDVFERPTPACMGPEARNLHLLPRLFGLRVDRDDGLVATDAGTPGRYHPLS